MDITEISSDGLKREYKVIVDKAEIETQVQTELSNISKRVKIAGFRPGKVPMPVLKQRYGSSVMSDVIEKTVKNTSGKAIMDKGLKPALEPKIEVTSFKEDGDLEYTMAVEVLPEIAPVDVSDITLEKPVYTVEQSEIDDAIAKLAERFKGSEAVEKARPAVMGDVLTIDFKGTVGGEARPGMNGDDFDLELGSHSFIDTFEDQLVGAKPGDHVSVTVTFPAQYHAKDLAGQEAVFEVDVKALKQAMPAALDDELAKKLGVESFDKLKDVVRERMQADYDSVTRLRLKRALLDELSTKYDFAVPEGMVEMEFETIWKKVEDELKSDETTSGKDEAELRTEYQGIANRRVRLGLLLNEIGRSQNLQVTKDEMNRALYTEAQSYPGQEKQVMDFYRKHPHMLENLRAPLYEDKVIDYLLTQVTLNDKAVTKAELIESAEEAETVS